MKNDTFLLYGAYGYTGELIARYAGEYDLRPVLAGRDEARLRTLADRLGFEYRCLGLDDPALLDRTLAEFPLVLHCAGPFIRTAKPMLEACLRTGTHYLDITGEIPVFGQAQRRDQRAREANILLMPGVGFDVVPTDCIAAFLHQALPSADRLELAFATVGGGVSHGTASSMLQKLGYPSAERRNGEIVPAPLGKRTLTVPFPRKERFVMSIPWGDVFTAYHTTKIPNIVVYTGIAPARYRWIKWLRHFNWLLRLSLVRKYLQRKIDRRPAGPSDEQRRTARSLVWGRVQDPDGMSEEARLQSADGYTLTVQAGLLIVGKVLAGEWKAGYHTPAGLFGPGLVLELPGVQRERLVEGEWEPA